MNIGQKGLAIITIPLFIEILFVAGLMHLMAEADADLVHEAHSKIVMRTAGMLGNDLLKAYAMHERYRWLGKNLITKNEIKDCFRKPITDCEALSELVRDDPSQFERASTMQASTNRIIKLMYMGIDFGPDIHPKFAVNLDNPIAIKFVGDMEEAGLKGLDTLDEIIATESKAELQNELIRTRHREQLQGFIRLGAVTSAVIAVVLALYFYRRIARRLALVFDNTRRLADALPLNPVLPGNDEIAQLDGAFHTMAISLKEAARKTNALIDNARDVICSLNENGNFLTVSSASTTVFGYAPDDLKGQPLKDKVTETELGHFAQELQSIRTGGERPPFETQFIRKDGRVIDILISSIWSEFEQTFFCVIHDVTEQKAVERLRQEVVEMVSHDLRSPLTVIQNFLMMLENGMFGKFDARGNSMLNSANSSTIRMLSLINDLLDIEKMEAGKLSLEKEPVSLDSVFDQAVQSVAPLAGDINVSLQSLPTDMVVLVDNHRIVQILVNLLTNAIKYSPEGGVVTVSACTISDADTDQNFEIRVSDQGRGIPPQMLKSIFNRFEQVTQSDATQKGGFGLGLAICKALAELHAGRVYVESEEGKGSTFVVRLPGLLPSGTAPTMVSVEASAQ